MQFDKAAVKSELVAPYLDIFEAHALLHAAAFDLVIHVVEHRCLVAPLNRHEVPECKLRPLIG